jgi:hypothetical protein
MGMGCSEGESMKECPKCSYSRSPQDDVFVPAAECPKCGVIYARAKPDVSLQPVAEPSRNGLGQGVGRMIEILVLIALVLAGGYFWSQYYQGSEDSAGGYRSEFTAVPWITDASANCVLIIGPTDKSHVGVRTLQLADRVSAQNIPYRIAHDISFVEGADAELTSGWTEMSRGGLPIVFINGRAKANPTINQVVTEFNHSIKSGR